MNKLEFIQLLRMIYGNKTLDIKKIQEFGLLAVKIGQVHALRIDFLPPEKCQELSKLYRANIPIPPEKALQNVDCKPFKQITTTPLASASVGQVYRARLKDNEEVVIKIVKPQFKEKFESEVKSIKSLFEFISFFYPPLKKVFNPIGILNNIEKYTLDELNLKNEVTGQETLKKIYQNNKRHPNLKNLRFPKIYKKYSNSKVMVSEYLPGKTFDELLDEKKLDYQTLLELFKIHGFYLFKIGTFHGDIHPGNIMLHNNHIYFVDTGAISTIKPKFSEGLLEFFDNLSKYNYEKASLSLYKMSETKLSKEQLEIFKQEFKELYKDFKGKTVSQVSLTKKMMDTIKLGVLNGMLFSDDMFPIIKSLMYLDGMVLRCNPNAKLIQDMKPFVKSFLKK